MEPLVASDFCLEKYTVVSLMRVPGRTIVRSIQLHDSQTYLLDELPVRSASPTYLSGMHSGVLEWAGLG